MAIYKTADGVLYNKGVVEAADSDLEIKNMKRESKVSMS